MENKFPITSIKGIGPYTAKKFQKLGIENTLDLIRFIPKRYLDYTNPKKINEIKENKEHITFNAKIEDIRSFYTKSRKLITQATAFDVTGRIKLLWFNNPYIKKIIQTNFTYTIAGQTSQFNNQLCLISPTLEDYHSDGLHTKGLVPIYPQTSGLKSSYIRKTIHNLLSQITLDDPLQKFSEIPHNISLQNSYRQIHFPKNKAEKDLADQRLSFNEHLKINLTNLIELNKLGKSPKINYIKKLDSQGLAKFPFDLTAEQRIVTKSIIKDLSTTQYTHRLIQGDTGSGKTATVILATNQIIANDQSCAILAPTQILANQHYETFKKFSLFPNNLSLFSGKIRGDSSNKPTIYIGTHALLSSLLTNDLTLVVIDEQHKFGVDQRHALINKPNPPHLVNLSATPIPRTIALGLLGDLSISSIKHKPKNRVPIKTSLVSQDYYQQKGLWWLIKKLQNNEKAYIVAPNISSNSNVDSVEKLYEKYKKILPKNISIYTLHGKDKPEIQNETLSNFKKDKMSVLIATSIIEVGLDIPDCNIMIIHSAERFGLAQLHQLRGRVGRDKNQGYCILVPSTVDQEENERLKLLTIYSSGLTLAKKDLFLRGSGEIFGKRQHGTFQTRLKHFWSKSSFLSAKKQSSTLINTSLDEAKNLVTQLMSC